MLYSILLFITISITYTLYKLSTISPDRKEILVGVHGNLWYLKASLIAPILFGKVVFDALQDYLAKWELDVIVQDTEEQRQLADNLKDQLTEEDLKMLLLMKYVR